MTDGACVRLGAAGRTIVPVAHGFKTEYSRGGQDLFGRPRNSDGYQGHYDRNW